MTNNYTLELLKKEEGKLLDTRDILNSIGENSEQVNIKIRNIENSIKTLESNRGLVVTGSEGGKLTINENGVSFSGNFTVRPANVATNVDPKKYKWDLTDDKNSAVNKLLNKEWNNIADKLEKGQNTMLDTIYEIAKLAIKDNEKETSEKVAEYIANKFRAK